MPYKMTSMANATIRISGIDDIASEPQLVLVRAGRRRFRVRRVDIEPLLLTQGHALSEQELSQLDLAATTAKAWMAALRMLARTPVTQAMMRAKLGRRFGDSAAHSVVDTLQRDGLIDDVEAAASLRRQLERSGPIGPAKLAQALAQHHVDPDVAQATLNDLATNQDALEAAMTAVDKMLPSLAQLTNETRRRRLTGRLARRGFDADTVQQALERLGPLCEVDTGYDDTP